MNRSMKDKPVPLLALTAALVIPALLPQSAHGMYDPKHGRWLQRDPLGVRPDAPKGRIEPLAQFGDGANVYQYVGGAPTMVFPSWILVSGQTATRGHNAMRQQGFAPTTT